MKINNAARSNDPPLVDRIPTTNDYEKLYRTTIIQKLPTSNITVVVLPDYPKSGIPHARLDRRFQEHGIFWYLVATLGICTPGLYAVLVSAICLQYGLLLVPLFMAIGFVSWHLTKACTKWVYSIWKDDLLYKQTKAPEGRVRQAEPRREQHWYNPYQQSDFFRDGQNSHAAPATYAIPITSTSGGQSSLQTAAVVSVDGRNPTTPSSSTPIYAPCQQEETLDEHTPLLVPAETYTPVDQEGTMPDWSSALVLEKV
eukprot:CAMPEP_0178736940 /NCGR_PEP_ID=MMETSP0744-20121128/2710_1 /TAXON_ID=913974 /ORGANISM="Nitzschia punctata, Strain CCMP561" /LENGTH=255 /DNA_ID=CAMNT_0020389451 /DNA_START=203 /DNA_END=970 /DNA_ORIENTATION=+